MWLAILSVILTSPLAFVFIDVVRVGPIGAAYAIVTDSAVICGLSLLLLWRGRAGLSIRGGSLHLYLGLIRSLFTVSLPSAAEGAVFCGGVLSLSGFAFRLRAKPPA